VTVHLWKVERREGVAVAEADYPGDPSVGHRQNVKALGTPCAVVTAEVEGYGRLCIGGNHHEPPCTRRASHPSPEKTADRLAAGKPRRDRRHLERDVLRQQGNQRRHICALKCVRIAVHLSPHLGIAWFSSAALVRFDLSDPPTRPLQETIDGGDANFQRIGDLASTPAEYLPQHKHRPLVSGQVLQGRDEREAKPARAATSVAGSALSSSSAASGMVSSQVIAWSGGARFSSSPARRGPLRPEGKGRVAARARAVRQEFIAIRYSHVRTDERPSNEPYERHARR